ncbi:hypothetical protein BH11PLA2_BH11PLA2_02290 [soil metagenome]
MKTDTVFRKMEKLDGFMSMKRGGTDATVKALEVDFFGAAITADVTPNDVKSLQSEMGLTFPEDYLSFLIKYGFALFDGAIIFGIAPVVGIEKKSFDFSVSRQTQSAKDEKPDDLGFIHAVKDGAVVGTDDSGGYYILFATSSAHSGKVSHIKHDSQWLEVDSWPSFTHYLKHCIENADM